MLGEQVHLPEILPEILPMRQRCTVGNKNRDLKMTWTSFRSAFDVLDGMYMCPAQCIRSNEIYCTPPPPPAACLASGASGDRSDRPKPTFGIVLAFPRDNAVPFQVRKRPLVIPDHICHHRLPRGELWKFRGKYLWVSSMRKCGQRARMCYGSG